MQGNPVKLQSLRCSLKKSLEEIAKDIASARDKAYDGEPLNPYEKFLFDAFMNMGNSTIEDLARSLKRRAEAWKY